MGICSSLTPSALQFGDSAPWDKGIASLYRCNQVLQQRPNHKTEHRLQQRAGIYWQILVSISRHGTYVWTCDSKSSVLMFSWKHDSNECCYDVGAGVYLRRTREHSIHIRGWKTGRKCRNAYFASAATHWMEDPKEWSQDDNCESVWCCRREPTMKGNQGSLNSPRPILHFPP